MVGKVKKKKNRVAWGITGSGDRLIEIVEVMKAVKKNYQDEVDIRVFLSKAGDQVIKYYKLSDELEENFNRIWVEINSNTPFLAGQLQLGNYDFLLIAPATSNTVAKISLGIADSLLTNSAIMALKSFVSVYLMPSDLKEGIMTTKLPSGRDLTLRIRKDDVDHVNRLARMENISILEKPEDIFNVFETRFRSK
jgi:archaeoflavoprotein AfpA